MFGKNKEESDGRKGLELIAVKMGKPDRRWAVRVKVSVEHGGEGFHTHSLLLLGPGDQKTERQSEAPRGSISQPESFMDKAA